MSKRNERLNLARKNKNDEFYTQYSDIEKEMTLHKSFFKDKVVYCPCDDYEKSEFVHFFLDHFDEYELKGLIATSYAYSGEKERNLFNSEIKKGKVLVKTWDDVHYGFLEGDGDFRSKECEVFFKKADVIITNPPFSLFRDFFDCLKKYNKDFLVLGNLLAIAYTNVFPYVKENKVWFTSTIKAGDTLFYVPDSYDLNACTCGFAKNGKKFIRVAGIRWFTNFDRREKPLYNLTELYSPEKYPKYDNLDAINVNKTKEIPLDYEGVMGVPITYFDKYNSSQFEIVGLLGNPILKGKIIYSRILIRRKKNTGEA